MSTVNNYLTTITPVDALQHAYTYLSPIDVLRFSRVSRDTYDALDHEKAAATKEIVLEHYRAAADCSVQGVTKHPGRPVFESVSSIPSEPSAFFISEIGTVRFLPYDLLVRNRERDRYLWHFFSGRQPEAMARKIAELFHYQQLVLQELEAQSRDPAMTLQDLRDRISQTELIQEESYLLLIKLRISHQFERWVQPPQIPIYVPNPRPLLQYLHSYRLMLSQTEVRIGEETVPVNIIAQLKFHQAKTVFTIDRYTDGQCLGAFSVRKSWRNLNELNIQNPRTYEPDTPFELLSNSYKLECRDVTDEIGRDAITGDYPIARLISQIAVELLSRENAEAVEFLPEDLPFEVLAMGDFTAMCQNQAEVKEATRRIRREQRKCFLPHEDRALQYGTSYLTRKSLTYLEDPACVDFDPDASPIPWAEYIAEHPLLEGSGPVFPHFFKGKLQREAPGSQP